MENNFKIGFAEALFIPLTIILSNLILILPKIILQSQGSSSIINIIYVTILALIYITLISKLYKNFKSMDILDISKYLFGNVFKFIIGLIYILHIVFLSSLLLRNTAENLRTMYAQSIPTPYIMFFILVAVSFITRKKLKGIIKSNLIVASIIIFFLIILFFLSTKSFVFERIFPIMGYGVKNIFVDGAVNISCFGNLIILFFLMPFLKNTNKFKKLSITCVIISGIILILVITPLLLMFPTSITSGSNIPVYLQTRSITIGNLIQRVDAFFVLMWIFCVLSYLSISIGFTTYIFNKICKIENSSKISYTFLGILFAISLIYTNIIQIRKLDIQGYKIFSLLIPFMLSFVLLLFANIKKIIKNRKEVVTSEW